MSSPGDAEPVTVGSLDNGERVLVLIGFPLIGALVGWVIQPIARWASDVDPIPFGRVTEAIASWHSVWATIVPIAVGVAAGLAFALYVLHDAASVVIGARTLKLTRGDKSATFDRDEIDAIFVDAKQLVLLDQRTAELARESFDSHADRLAAELRQRRYPWFDGDPYAASYRRWLDGAPELSYSEHFVLRTREKALENDDKDDLADLRRELTRLGLVIRDEGHRQYWRRAH